MNNLNIIDSKPPVRSGRLPLWAFPDPLRCFLWSCLHWESDFQGLSAVVLCYLLFQPAPGRHHPDHAEGHFSKNSGNDANCDNQATENIICRKGCRRGPPSDRHDLGVFRDGNDHLLYIFDYQLSSPELSQRAGRGSRQKEGQERLNIDTSH